MGATPKKREKKNRRKNSSAIKQREKGRRHREGKLMGPRSYAKIQKIKDEKRKIKTHPTTWRRPRLSYLCSSLPDRATKHAIFESFELKRKVALKKPSVKKTTVKD
jgi:hypothetical protein